MRLSINSQLDAVLFCFVLFCFQLQPSTESHKDRLFTFLYFSVRLWSSSALRYGLASCMSLKTTQGAGVVWQEAQPAQQAFPIELLRESQRWKGEGEGEGFLLSPPPPPSLLFFFSRPSFSRRTRAETLATQASWFLLSPPPPRHSFFFLSSQRFSTNLARKRLQRRLEEARKIEGL